MPDQPVKRLVNYTKETYEGSFNTDLLEQYKLYVQSAENISARRLVSSNYLLTLNTALVALYGFQSVSLKNYLAILIPVMGIFACLLWCRIIKSHRDLNTVKFGIIHELEQHLPVAPFDYEWEKAEQGQGKSYSPVTQIEQWIPMCVPFSSRCSPHHNSFHKCRRTGLHGMITESTVEDATLGWLKHLGWDIIHGPDIAPDTLGSERNNYEEVVLVQRLRNAFMFLNPNLPIAALEDAIRKLTRPEGSTLKARNHAFHRMFVDGVTVEYRTDDGAVRGAQVRAIDFDNPVNNDWLAVNQFTVVENKHERRPDVVLFVNGLPLGVIELKNPANEEATIWTAWQQLQTYKAELPTLFSMNAALMVSDGMEARIGTLTAGREWFKPWRTISGEVLADSHMLELQVMLEGVCAPKRFLSLIRDFIVFEDDGSTELVKKMAGYHQFHAVEAAITETLRAAELKQEMPKTQQGFRGVSQGVHRVIAALVSSGILRVQGKA